MCVFDTARPISITIIAVAITIVSITMANNFPANPPLPTRRPRDPGQSVSLIELGPAGNPILKKPNGGRSSSNPPALRDQKIIAGNHTLIDTIDNLLNGSIDCVFERVFACVYVQV